MSHRLSGYGYGVFVGELNDPQWWHHSGHNAGFKAFAANIPDLGRRIVVLTNTEAMDADTVEPLLA
ncbi:CubicO group peptidase (beta-lactamase class C family) [Micromonospora sp. A200]|uniref:serine hydrolase n=1 Tax=Micromonospora sp. A200 TaxID=2940568 RepID=UPI002476DE55|nr:serine hydrolase [Micromonospora sp. A200]MDH6465747.1 CubicO group peptidase (beta-lactamase class C family) [Micromonospora sp. A200]